MAADDAIAALRDKAVLWSAGFVGAAEVVRSACDVLAAGRGGMALAMLAGVHLRRADQEAPEFIPDALAEVGLPFFPPGGDGTQAAWLVAMASCLLKGQLTPQQLAAWAHRQIGHNGCELGQVLAAFDDEYDIALGMGDDTSSLDAEVVAEARRITARSG